MAHQKFDALYVVGGGSQNRLLCQFAADALQRPVIAGPVEATALGNIAVQAVATGALPSLTEARQIIKRSANAVTYTPGEGRGWVAAYERFSKLVGEYSPHPLTPSLRSGKGELVGCDSPLHTMERGWR